MGGIAGGQIATRAIRRVGLRGALAPGPTLIALGIVLLTRITPTNGAALGTSLASVVATSIALAVGGDPAVAATTGYQATLYLALLLSVIAPVLAILAQCHTYLAGPMRGRALVSL